MTMPTHDLLFVVALSDLDVASRRLLSSDCLRPGRYPLWLHWNARSAAEAFNAALDSAPDARWVIWVHQDVYLPPGWDTEFLRKVESANEQLARDRRQIGVAGVYGLAGTGAAQQRAGHILDRGRWLHESTTLPCAVDSLDEMLLAVPADTPLRMDATLGFDFYATDLVLQGQSRGLTSVVIQAPCEHWSDTPTHGTARPSLVERIGRSGEAFEAKWSRRLPVATPLLEIRRPGDVRHFLQVFAKPS